MMNPQFVKSALLISLLSLTIASTTHAQPPQESAAQQTLKGAPALEEILVTAQRRTQSLQDVPISISIVSALDLARNAIFEFAETAQLTPGVELFSSSPALAAIKLRGVGPDFFASGAAQSVPIFVDEVAMSQPGAVFSTLIDVERVELLRGPQGTLYGRNAPGGAYNMTTVAPNFEGTAGFVQGSYSQWTSNNEPTVDARGAINLPLVDDTLAVRLRGVYAQSDGGVDMKSPLATENTTGGKDHKSLSARMLWNISERSELHLDAGYKDLEDYYAWQFYDGQVPGTGGANPVAAIQSRFSDRADYGTNRSGSDSKVEDLSLRFFREGDLTNITAIVAYQEFTTDFVQNQAPYPKLEQDVVALDLTTEQYTMELRASDSGDVFDYVAGIFLISRESIAEGFLSVGGADIDNLTNSETLGKAAFGNVTYHVSERWDLSGGLRYDINDDELFSDVSIAGFPAAIDESLEFEHLSWSLKLNHYMNENTTFYLAVDNAYREGGLNPYIPSVLSIGEALGNDTIVSTSALYFETDEEVSTAIELGVKGHMMDKRIRYTADVFYQEYDDHIATLPLPNSPDLDIIGALYTLINTNVDEVVTQGVEFDFTYLMSQHWVLDVRFAYSDATIGQWSNKLCSDEYGDPVGEPVCPAGSGEDLTSLPKFNTNVQLHYERTIADDWDFFTHMAWTWKSKSDANGITDRYNDPLNFFNINLGVTKGNFIVSLWGKNLTDEISDQFPVVTENGDPTQPSALAMQFDPGREIGLTLGYEF